MAERTFMQAAQAGDSGAVTFLDVPYGSPTTAGSLLVMVAFPGTANVSSVTDTQGNVWFQAEATGDSSLWYSFASVGGANTVTLHYSATDIFGTAIVGEWSGQLGEPDPFDSGNAAASTSALADTGPFTTSQGDETLILGVNANAAGADNSSHGFTLRGSFIFGEECIKDSPAASAGVYHGLSDVNAGNWIALCAAFKPVPPPNSAILWTLP